MSFSGILSGIVIFVIGILMIKFAMVDDAPGLVIIGMVFISTGLYMVINTRKEDKIEGVKHKKNKS